MTLQIVYNKKTLIKEKIKNLEIHICFIFQVQPLYQAHYLLSEHFKNVHVKTLPLKQKLATASRGMELGQLQSSFESPIILQ